MASDAKIPKHLILVPVVGVATRVVGVHSKIMSKTVGEEGHADALLEQLILRAAQNSQLQQTLDCHAVSVRMHIIPQHTVLQHGNALQLHLQDDLVDLARLLGEPSAQRDHTGNVRTVGAVLATRVNEDVLLSLLRHGVRQLRVVLGVVQRGAVLAAGYDRVVRLLARAVGDAGRDERALDLALVGRSLGSFDGGNVRFGGDVVGFSQQRNLICVLDDARLFDPPIQQGEVGVLEALEFGLRRDAALDGVCDGFTVVCGRNGGEGRVDFGCGEHVVHVVELHRFRRGEGQAGPDDVLGVNCRDEECQLVGAHVVDERSFGQQTSREVEERTALSVRRSLSISCARLY